MGKNSLRYIPAVIAMGMIMSCGGAKPEPTPTPIPLAEASLVTPPVIPTEITPAPMSEQEYVELRTNELRESYSELNLQTILPNFLGIPAETKFTILNRGDFQFVYTTDIDGKIIPIATIDYNPESGELRAHLENGENRSVTIISKDTPEIGIVWFVGEIDPHTDYYEKRRLPIEDSEIMMGYLGYSTSIGAIFLPREDFEPLMDAAAKWGEMGIEQKEIQDPFFN